MKIYSYYHPVIDLNFEDEMRLSIEWRRRWSAIGFEPVILNEWIAQKHADFPQFNEAVSRLPTCNPVAYERACYLRWMALAVVGGGWMADLDVFPQARTLDRDNPYAWASDKLTRMMDFSDDGRLFNAPIMVLQKPCCPSMAFASKENAERLCLEFATANIGNRPQGDRAHYSDQYALEDLVVAGEEWIQVRDTVKQWPDTGWQDALLVHLPNAALGPRNKLPKWRHVAEILDSK